MTTLSTSPAAPSNPFYSRFGGLWTDRLDARSELERRVACGSIEAEAAPLYRHFIDKGFVILPNAVSAEVLSALAAEVEHAWTTGEGDYMLDILGEYRRLSPELRHKKYKLLDLYVHSESARRASFCPAIATFLRTVFDEPGKAFQSLSFERGTEQALHQDTAYVVVEEPLKFVASWIALEDVQPGTGELEYYEGSHRLPDFLFHPQRKHHEPRIDGHDAHMRFLSYLHEESQRLGLKRSRFLPKRGDALIWAADLAHGGSPIENTNATRRSLVTHYCPRSVSPHYMKGLPKQRWVAGFEGNLFCSMYYPLPKNTQDVGLAGRPANVNPRPAAPKLAPTNKQPAKAPAPAPSTLPTPLRKLRAALRKKVLVPLKRRLRGA